MRPLGPLSSGAQLDDALVAPRAAHLPHRVDGAAPNAPVGSSTGPAGASSLLPAAEGVSWLDAALVAYRALPVEARPVRAPLPRPDQLDVASAVLRIEQLAREGFDAGGGVIWDRLVTCDVPRLRAMLGPDVLGQMDEAAGV